MGDRQILARALNALSLADAEQGRAHCPFPGRREPAGVPEEENAFDLSMSLTSLGMIVLNQGDYAQASSLPEESTAVCRGAGGNRSLPLRPRPTGRSSLTMPAWKKLARGSCAATPLRASGAGLYRYYEQLVQGDEDV